MKKIKTFAVVAFCFVIASCINSAADQRSGNDTLDQVIVQSTQSLKELSNDEILTKDRIDKTGNDQLEDLVAENVYLNFHVGDENSTTTKEYRTEYDKFSTEQRMIYATIILERNVKESGFEGYFHAYQSVGQFADYATAGYKTLNLAALEEIVNEAIATFRSKPPAMQEKLRQLTDDFNRQLQEHSPSAERTKYIRLHKEKFAVN